MKTEKEIYIVTHELSYYGETRSVSIAYAGHSFAAALKHVKINGDLTLNSFQIFYKGERYSTYCTTNGSTWIRSEGKKVLRLEKLSK